MKLHVFQMRFANFTGLAKSLALIIVALAALNPSAHAQSLDLAPYKGKVIYVDFWASWCGPCRQSFPWMNSTYADFKARGFEIVAVNLDQDQALAKTFLSNFTPQFPVVFDPKGVVATDYHVTGMPTAVLIGRDGRMRFTHDGFKPEKESEYVSHIMALLDEKAP